MRRIAPLDLVGNEIRNARAHVLAAAPANPTAGQFYYNSGDGVLYYFNGTTWVAARTGAPEGPAGGDLAGTYPNPTIRTGAVTAASVLDGTLTDAEFAAANKDGAAGVASLRTLGTGAAQAAAGNDTRIVGAEQRANKGVASGYAPLDAGSKVPAANLPVGTGTGTVAAGDDARIVGAEQIANKGAAGGYAPLNAESKVPYANLIVGNAAGTVAAGNDARLSDQRTPLDDSVTAAKIVDATITDVEIAAGNKDGLAATPSLRTLGTGATQAAAGNDPRFTDSRTPTGGAGGDLTGTYPNPTIRALAINDGHVAAANKDGAVGTPSLRTLGTGAQQAAAGNDARLSDQRTPVDASVTNAKVATNAAIAHEKIAAPVAAYSWNNQRLINLADPTTDTDAANKRYVDRARQGLDFKDSVRVATTGNIALTGVQTIDGVSVAAGDRVLVKNQTDAAANGIYVAAAAAWTRAVDADAAGEISPGTLTFVEVGSTNGGQQWVVTATGAATWTPGTTTSTWGQFSGATATSAGLGLVANGNVFNVGAGQGIVVGQDSIAVDSTVVVRKFARALTGTGASEVVSHGLGTADVTVAVYEVATGEEVGLDVEHTDANTVTLRWGTAPGAGYRVVVHG